MAGLLVLGGAWGTGGAWGAAGVGARTPEPEADVSYHGRVSLDEGRLRVWLVPHNEGPNALADTTLRVRLSEDLADRQEPAEGCARAGRREVVCETGPLPAHGQGRHIALVIGLREPVTEVVVRVDTLWNGDAADRNSGNNEHTVLALDTGDAYAF